jgi:hypothetical protein
MSKRYNGPLRGGFLWARPPQLTPALALICESHPVYGCAPPANGALEMAMLWEQTQSLGPTKGARDDHRRMLDRLCSLVRAATENP